MRYRYRLEFEPDDNGTVLVTSPDFPPLVTYGDDEAEAQRHAMDALTSLIASMMDAGQSVPAPSAEGDGPSIAQPLLMSLKIELHRAMMESGVGRSELGQRLGWRDDAVTRLFRLSHAARIEDFDKAFRALGRDIAIEAKRDAVSV